MGFLTDSIRGGINHFTATGVPFDGASQNRLNLDWAVSVMSPDQEVRVALRSMRGRSRNLGRNHDYAIRFLNKAKENVIGPNGITLEMALPAELVPQAEKCNRSVENGWLRYCDKATADQKQSFVEAAQLSLTTVLQDGENFLRKVKGYPYNKSRFAIQFLDADQFPETLNEYRGMDSVRQGNDVRMAVEVDEWRRAVAYHAYEGHPSEQAGLRRIRIPASELEHAYIFKRPNQTRGIPWLHTAMSKMNMLGKYEEAEVVGSRMAACKMASLESKTGDDYQGGKRKDSGAVEIEVQPASMLNLPEGVHLNPIDWNHPNVAFGEFVSAILRGVAVGLNVSYSTLTGDLRQVNFSSIRQGILDEREGWKVLQTFAIDHIYRPVFFDWLVMAVTTGQVELPSSLPLDLVAEYANWTPRGWDWVDPSKDADADIKGRRAGLTTAALICAKRGLDWRMVYEQIAKEESYARQLGISLDFSTAGMASIDAEEEGSVPGRNGGNE